MKFKYNFQRKDFINYLKDSNKIYNYLCLIIFTLFYFISCFDLITTDFGSIMLSFVISILILYSVMIIISHLFIKFMVSRNDKIMHNSYGEYNCEVNDFKIIQNINGKVFEIKYDDIYRITKNKNWLIVYPKDGKIVFLFIKNLVGEKTFKEITTKITDKYNSIKPKTIQTIDSSEKKLAEKEKNISLKNDKEKKKNIKPKSENTVKQKKTNNKNKKTTK